MLQRGCYDDAKYVHLQPCPNTELFCCWSANLFIGKITLFDAIFYSYNKSFVIPVQHTAVFMHICIIPTAGNKIHEISANL